MLNLDTIIVLAVIIFIVIFLYREIFRPSVVFLIGIVVLSITGILTPHEVLVGFSNEQIAVIVLLLIFGRILNKTSVINLLFDKLFRETKSYLNFLFRMMFGVAGISAFINNTPIVAMLIPYVYNWGKRNKIAESKLMIPLSYASILGGCATLIGTSTNLIVNGLVVESGLESLSIFDFSYVGIPLLFIGIAYILLIGRKLLPAKKDVVEDFEEKTKEYIVDAVVLKDSPLIGKTIEENNLRHLRGLFVVEILRGSKKIAPVKPDEIINEGDMLIFAGMIDTIVDLVNSNMGLSLPKADIIREQEKIDIVEAVVSHNSVLIGKTVKTSDFRKNHDSAILAIHRNNEKLSGKIGNIKLHSGDVLLLLSGKDFWKRVEEWEDLYIITKVKEIHNIDMKKIITSL